MRLVQEEYSLQSLTIDSSMSCEQIIVCCEHLVTSSSALNVSLADVRICIAPFFSVMNDGEMCIMWNWKDS